MMTRITHDMGAITGRSTVVRPRMPSRWASPTAAGLVAVLLVAATAGSLAGCSSAEPVPATPADAVQPSGEPTSGCITPTETVAPAARAASAPARGIPVELRIPAIGVEAPVVPVGRDPDGHMSVPDGPVLTGWYSLRARPGEQGSAVIAGHSGFRTGAAVFDNLGQLEPGDVVYTEDEHGRTVTFLVRESRQYDWDAYVPEVFRRDDGAFLNLITCTGPWNPMVGTSSKRLIVFCDLRDPRPFAERVRNLIE